MILQNHVKVKGFIGHLHIQCINIQVIRHWLQILSVVNRNPCALLKKGYLMDSLLPKKLLQGI